MMRNLIVLGCAGLLALGLSFATFAGTMQEHEQGVGDRRLIHVRREVDVGAEGGCAGIVRIMREGQVNASGIGWGFEGTGIKTNE